MWVDWMCVFFFFLEKLENYQKYLYISQLEVSFVSIVFVCLQILFSFIVFCVYNFSKNNYILYKLLPAPNGFEWVAVYASTVQKSYRKWPRSFSLFIYYRQNRGKRIQAAGDQTLNAHREHYTHTTPFPPNSNHLVIS